MEAAAKSAVLTPIRVRLPEVPSIGEEELSQAFVRGFVAALHTSREKADQEVAREVQEEASFAARELLANGVVGDREDVELPAALLGTFFRILGCSVSAWQESRFRGFVRVEECPVRRALGLTGMDCSDICRRMREGVLSTLDGPACSARSPGGPACVIEVRLGESGR